MVGPDTFPKDTKKRREFSVRIAVYGGSFNPPHRAHALVADWVVSSGSADAVWLVPVFQHAFEGQHNKTLAPFSDRVRWCEAMTRDLKAPALVSRVEAELPTPSYSVDTLDFMAEKHGEHSFHLVIGADILDAVDSWKEWGRIQKDYTPIVVGREGYSTQVDAPIFPNISSTDVRRRASLGLTLSGLVTPSVAQLLEEGNPWVE